MDSVMKIVCPSCDAAYEVPESVVTSRRKMRCARCASNWVPADQEGVAVLAEPVPAPPSAQPPAAPIAQPPAAPAMQTAPAPVPDLPGPVRPREPEAVAAAPPEPALRHDPVSRAEAAEAPAAAREEEPYQLALRPDTPMRVFPPEARPIYAPSRPDSVPVASRAPLVLAWGASVLLLAAIVAGFLTFRAPVMKAWPPSTRLYAALGFSQP